MSLLLTFKQMVLGFILSVGWTKKAQYWKAVKKKQSKNNKKATVTNKQIKKQEQQGCFCFLLFLKNQNLKWRNNKELQMLFFVSIIALWPQDHIEP